MPRQKSVTVSSFDFLRRITGVHPSSSSSTNTWSANGMAPSSGSDPLHSTSKHEKRDPWPPGDTGEAAPEGTADGLGARVRRRCRRCAPLMGLLERY
jgi:hypothetical protein